MEWSKYSCEHQGAHAHAEHSQKLTFVPSGCSLPDVGSQSYALPRGRRIVFNGDSLIRQIFIAFACLMSWHVKSYVPKWQQCGCSAPCQPTNMQSWPCHGTLNCIECGPHSGFETASVILENGCSLYFGDVGKPLSTDVYIVETGVHGNRPRDMANARLRGLVTNLLRANSTVVWLITPQDAFKSASGNGVYNATFLAHGASQTKICVKSTPAIRSAGEWQALHNETNISSKLAGVVELDGLNDQGDAKIGGGVGTHGDCQHYCMPGVPDILARAVSAMLRAVL